MVARIIEELGPWTWWVVGLALLAMEIIVPGVFLVWIGIAAVFTGILSLLFWDVGFWVWQAQLVVFALLSILAVLVGRRLLLRSGHATDQPLLNQRGQSLVGRTATLEQPISEGRGRIRLNDTTWAVQGPDLPIGTRIRVVSCVGNLLTVEAA